MGETQKGGVLVCVTGQRGCDRLIRRGRDIAGAQGLPLCVLHVCTNDAAMGSREESAALNYLFQLSHEVDAEMIIIYGRNPAEEIIKFARAQGVRHLVVGVNPDAPEGGVIGELQRELPGVGVEVCGG